MDDCTNCTKPSNLKCACEVMYCSTKCQTQHWPSHKTKCWFDQGLLQNDFSLILKSAKADFQPAKIKLGFHYFDNKDMDEALYWFKQTDSFADAAKCYIEKNMLDEAETWASKGVLFESTKSYFVYGCLLLARNNYEQGVKWLEEAANNDYREALLLLCSIRREENDFEKVNYFNKKIEKHNDPESLVKYCRRSNERGEFDLALEHLTRAIKLGCKDTEEVLEKLGRTSEWRLEFQ